MFKSLFGDKHQAEGKVLIEQSELDALRQKVASYEQIDLTNSISIAQQMKSNAHNVNTATQQRLSAIEDSYQLVRDFIEQSRSVENISQSSFELLSRAKILSGLSKLPQNGCHTHRQILHGNT